MIPGRPFGGQLNLTFDFFLGFRERIFHPVPRVVEVVDQTLCLDHLAAELPGRPLTLMGFSFGAWLTLKVGAPDPRVGALIALGVPVGWAELGFLAGCGKPKLFVHGTRDQFCDPEELRRRYPDFCAPKHLEWIEGADHFFTNQLDELAAVLRERFPSLV